MTESTDQPKVYRRLPPWLKRRLPAAGHAGEVHRLLAELDLATVCTQAHCPNQCECYARGTATFLILGDTCTRNCRFCAVDPRDPGPPRAEEPRAVAEAAARMSLKYVVITSVTRDDLPDGGADHFAKTISAVRDWLPSARVEVLVPDFVGRADSVATVMAARPDVFNHNVETVPRLYPAARPQADYRRSLNVLSAAREHIEPGQKLFTKSGLMLGLGETMDEVRTTMRDLCAAGCDVLTIGQYLAPSSAHLPVARFVEPTEFDQLKDEGERMGFRAVAAGPFVRSSYRAETVFDDA